MSEPLRVGVMGAGAIGCWIGGKLMSRGAEVVFVARERVRDELAAHGLRVADMKTAEIVFGPGAVTVVTDPVRVAACDVVLVSVKSEQTAEAGAALAFVIPPGTIVISLQNGMRNADVLRAALPGRKVLGGIVGFNVLSKGEGVFRRATTGLLAIEHADDPRLDQLVGMLRAERLDVRVTKDIRGMQWSKLLMNLNNAVSALTDATTQELVFVPRYRRILAALIAESLAVMKIADIRPARLSPIPTGLFPYVLRLPTPVLRVVARAQLEIDPEARSSMWEDLTRRRRTEIDHLNGEIVRLAEKAGTDAPLNRRMVELVRAAEERANGSPKMSADALWGALFAR
jgi:2-dehydropantoate 2-reductase